MRIAPWISILVITVASFGAGVVLAPAFQWGAHWGRQEIAAAVMLPLLVVACARDLVNGRAAGSAGARDEAASDTPAG